MIVKYNTDTLINVYRSLSYRIISHVKHYQQGYRPLDSVVASILKGNACDIAENAEEIIDEVEEDRICIYYIKHATGNDENLFMDVIHLYGLTHIIVFLDYFDNVIDYFPDVPEHPEEASVEELAVLNLGNSNYFTAIQTIVTVICDIIIPLHSNNTSFAMCDTFRKVPSFIAGRIIDFIREFDFDVDAGTVPMDRDEFMHWISRRKEVTEKQFEARLLGVKG